MVSHVTLEQVQEALRYVGVAEEVIGCFKAIHSPVQQSIIISFRPDNFGEQPALGARIGMGGSFLSFIGSWGWLYYGGGKPICFAHPDDGDFTPNLYRFACDFKELLQIASRDLAGKK